MIARRVPETASEAASVTVSGHVAVGPDGGSQRVEPRAAGSSEPTSPRAVVVDGHEARAYVPMSHRGGLPGPRPGVVSGGAIAAVVTVLAPIAFVVALLAVPAGTLRNVLLLVGWLVIAVAVEQVDRRRRRSRRPTGRRTTAVTDGLFVAGPDHAPARQLEGVLDP